MWNEIGHRLSFALMDAVRCTLARIVRGNCDAEVWLLNAGVDIERLNREKL